METYKNIDEFIQAVFPQEVEKILKESKTPIQKFIETSNEGFDSDMAAIIGGKAEDCQPKNI